MRFKKPNFRRNIINISATFSKFLGAETDKPQLKILEKELKKDYKNVVFMIFDGMGINPMNINLNKNSILSKNIKQKLTSVFPSTTTSATTALMSCKYPMEHGWLAWSVYLDFMDKVVDLYPSCDSYTKEKIDAGLLFEHLPYSPYYLDNKSNYCLNTVFPPFMKIGPVENNVFFENTSEMANAIKTICKKEGKQFIYCYNPEPDSTMHMCGVSSVEAKAQFDDIIKNIEDLYKEIDDTVFVITADHGQVDIGGYIEFFKQEDINELLEVKPFLEPRAAGFIVKRGKEKEFEKLFNKYYKKDFKLYKTQKLVDKNYFGLKDFKNHRKMLGDYIAICKTNKMFIFAEDRHYFKGHHTSLTKEIEVPLIILSKQKK